MNNRIFPRITLTPWNLQDTRILDSLPSNICDWTIKKILLEHIRSYHLAHRPEFPNEPKDFYIVSFRDWNKACIDIKLNLPKFSSLYLPSVALSVLKIRSIVPENLIESPIIAYDNYFSIFPTEKALAVDLSFGEAQFVLWERGSGFNFDLDYQFLVEAEEI